MDARDPLFGDIPAINLFLSIDDPGDVACNVCTGALLSICANDANGAGTDGACSVS